MRNYWEAKITLEDGTEVTKRCKNLNSALIWVSVARNEIEKRLEKRVSDVRIFCDDEEGL